MFETTSLCDESLVLIRFTEGGLEKCLLRRGEGVNYTVDSIIVVAENNLNPSKRKDMEKIVAIIANQMILHLMRLIHSNFFVVVLRSKNHDIIPSLRTINCRS